MTDHGTGLVAGFVYCERDKLPYVPAIYNNGRVIWREYHWKGWTTPELATEQANVILNGALGKLFGDVADPPNEP